MGWSYSFNPSHSPKDNVRFLVGDTVETDPLLHDEEINFLLKQAGGSVFAAASAGCEAIMAKLSRAVDESVGSVSISFSQRLAGFEKLLVTLRRRSTLNSGIRPFSGGIRRDDRRRYQQDNEFTAPIFTVEDGLYGVDRCWGQCWADATLSADGPLYGDDGISQREIAAGATDRGDQIFSGPIDPTASLPGQTGDYYFNTTTKTLFGPHI